jgi:competence protein CoiA
VLKFAFNAKRLIIPISRAEKNVFYTCVECGKKLIPKLNAQSPHFAHAQEGVCRQTGTSLTHTQTQRYLQALFPCGTCFLEYPFPKLGRIADVYCPKRKFVFEIQCSPISIEEVEKRNGDYGSLGLQVIWILHTGRYNPKRFGNLQKAIQHIPHYYSCIDENQKGFIFDLHPITKKALRVDFSALPRRPRFFYIEKHPLETLRTKKWKVSFRGDLLWRLDHNQIPELPSPRVNPYPSLVRRVLKKLIMDRFH